MAGRVTAPLTMDGVSPSLLSLSIRFLLRLADCSPHRTEKCHGVANINVYAYYQLGTAEPYHILTLKHTGNNIPESSLPVSHDQAYVLPISCMSNNIDLNCVYLVDERSQCTPPKNQIP